MYCDETNRNAMFIAESLEQINVSQFRIFAFSQLGQLQPRTHARNILNFFVIKDRVYACSTKNVSLRTARR